MVRRGRVVFRRPRSKRRREDEDDDDDEEYVVGEDEEQEESSEESLEVSDEEGSFEHDSSMAEDEGTKARRSKPKPRSKKKGRARARSSRVRKAMTSDDDDEEDRDFHPDDDDDVDAVDDDNDDDPFDDEEISQIPRRKLAPKPRGKNLRSTRGSAKPERVRAAAKPSKGTSRRRTANSSNLEEEEDDDDDFDADFRDPPKKQMKNKLRKKLPNVDRLPVGSDTSDSDFVVSEEESSGRDELPERKEKTSRATNRKRKNGRASGDSYSEFSDFVVSEEEFHFENIQRGKRTAKVKRPNSKNRKRRAKVLLESESSDFLVSEEELSAMDLQKKNKENTRRRPGIVTKKRRVQIPEQPDSESDFSDFVISDDELKDLGVEGVSNGPQPKRVFAGRKDELKDKWKGKEVEDLGKQICGICLSEEQNNTIRGVLECCSHFFCFACIMEWSKVENRCPVCKRRFCTISKSGRFDTGSGLRRSSIRVPVRDQVYQPSEEELRGFLDPYENVVCMECQQGGDDYLMLLCDMCDSPAHTYCVGLGRAVPEGNWYCQVCRPIDDRSSLQEQGTEVDCDVPTGGLLSNQNSAGPCTTGDTDTHSSTVALQSASFHGQSSPIFDLNRSPRYPWRDDEGAVSQAPAHGTSTLSWRRTIQIRIRSLLSSGRQRRTSPVAHMQQGDMGRSDATTSQVVHEETARQPDASVRPNPTSSGSLGFRQPRQTRSPTSPLRPYRSVAPNEGSSFRVVHGARDQVLSMVKRHVNNLRRHVHLEASAFKDIARRSTHTILASCGIQHRGDQAVYSFQSPSACPHSSEAGPSDLVEGCCSSCFDSFVKDVVEKVAAGLEGPS